MSTALMDGRKDQRNASLGEMWRGGGGTERGRNWYTTYVCVCVGGGVLSLCDGFIFQHTLPGRSLRFGEVEAEVQGESRVHVHVHVWSGGCAAAVVQVVLPAGEKGGEQGGGGMLEFI